MVSWPGFSFDCNAVCRSTGGAAITHSYAFFMASPERGTGLGGRGGGACNLELFNCHARLIWQHIMQLQLQQVLPNEANQSLSDKQLWEEKKRGEESDKEAKKQKVKMEKQQQRQQRSCHAKPATFDQHFVLGSIWIYQSVTCDKDERKYNSKGVKERGLEGEGVCIYKGRITERGGWHVQE